MPDFDLDSALAAPIQQRPRSLCCGTALMFSEIDTRDVDAKELRARCNCSECDEDHTVRYRFVGYTSHCPAVQARLDQLPEGHFSYFDCPMCGEGTLESLGMKTESGHDIGHGTPLPFRWHNAMWCPPCGHYDEHFEAEGTID